MLRGSSLYQSKAFIWAPVKSTHVLVPRMIQTGCAWASLPLSFTHSLLLCPSTQSPRDAVEIVVGQEVTSAQGDVGNRPSVCRGHQFPGSIGKLRQPWELASPSHRRPLSPLSLPVSPSAQEVAGKWRCRLLKPNCFLTRSHETENSSGRSETGG